MIIIIIIVIQISNGTTIMRMLQPIKQLNSTNMNLTPRRNSKKALTLKSLMNVVHRYLKILCKIIVNYSLAHQRQHRPSPRPDIRHLSEAFLHLFWKIALTINLRGISISNLNFLI